MSLALAAAIVHAAPPADAQPNDQDKALASALFDQAKALLADGKVADACRKLEESRRLDPLPGTLLNLAVCHEQEGLLASAYGEFREARALAERDHRPDRVELADERMRAIEPRISALVIVVAPSVDLAGLVVTRDGTPIGRAAWGARIPVDPGIHVVEASLPGKKPWKAAVTVEKEGDVKTVALTALEDAPPPPSAPPLLPVTVTVSPPPERAPTTSRLSSQRIAALATLGVGLVGVGVGSYLGIRAIDDHTSSQAPGNVALNDDAKTCADASTGTMIVGLAGLAIGTFLWFWAPHPHDSAAATVLPLITPGTAGLQVGGAL